MLAKQSQVHFIKIMEVLSWLILNLLVLLKVNEVPI